MKKHRRETQPARADTVALTLLRHSPHSRAVTEAVTTASTASSSMAAPRTAARAATSPRCKWQCDGGCTAGGGRCQWQYSLQAC